MRIRLLLLPIVCLLASDVHGWSSKEHIQFTRIAAERLIADPETPPAMKQWLKEVVSGLTDMKGEEDYFLHQHIGARPAGFEAVLFYCTQPDMHALNEPNKKIAPFNVAEKLHHFIDLELFLAGDQKREYRDDLFGKPKLEDIPHVATDPRFLQAGYLPFRVEYCYAKFVESIRAGQMIHAETKLEDEEDSAARWGAYLAHYLEDNTQPHHATMDYKSASYFANPRKSPNVHAEVEYRMADDDKLEHAELRREFWPLFVKALESVKDPADTDDLFKATCEISLYSYDALPMIGRAAQKAVRPVEGSKPDEIDTEVFFRESGEFHGQSMTVMQMKALQTALAVKRVERVWKQAWNEATKK